MLNNVLLQMKKRKEKLQAYDLRFSIGKSYFTDDGRANFLTFEPFFNTFTRPAFISEKMEAWESRGLPNEKIRPPTTETTHKKKQFFWSNPYIIEVVITSLIEMLELPIFGHMNTSTI